MSTAITAEAGFANGVLLLCIEDNLCWTFCVGTLIRPQEKDDCKGIPSSRAHAHRVPRVTLAIWVTNTWSCTVQKLHSGVEPPQRRLCRYPLVLPAASCTPRLPAPHRWPRGLPTGQTQGRWKEGRWVDAGSPWGTSRSPGSAPIALSPTVVSPEGSTSAHPSQAACAAFVSSRPQHQVPSHQK